MQHFAVQTKQFVNFITKYYFSKNHSAQKFAYCKCAVDVLRVHAISMKTFNFMHASLAKQHCDIINVL